jgi:tripartite-type tricarboxylate transporter receptor subunit TctC
MQNLSRRAALALGAAGAIAPFGSAFAQTAWPDKPIRIINPYAPGGIADLAARIIQPGLQNGLGQPIIIESKPGASGSLGTEYVARATPDGYTLLLALAAPQTLNQYIFKSVNYDGLKDFAPIALINTNPLVLMVNPQLPVNNVRELISYAKANPGKLNFAGAGGLTQFSGEIFKHVAGVDMVHVPYRGGAPAVAAAAAGDVQLTFANFSDALTWMRSGRLRAIALTSAKRFPQAPEVPTIAESGLPGFEVTGWSGLMAPAGTPPAIVDRIARVLQKDFAEPAMRKRWESIGAEPGHADPAVFAAMIRSEMQKWSEFVKRTGIKVES